jgi:hypothetical protein
MPYARHEEPLIVGRAARFSPNLLPRIPKAACTKAKHSQIKYIMGMSMSINEEEGMKIEGRW